ncbi:unnamed protein product [Leuciscus chuanchicus]
MKFAFGLKSDAELATFLLDRIFEDYRTLGQSEEATAEVGQKYTINTLDLGVCMEVLPLVWKVREKYKYNLVLPGQFHTAMNYLSMITNHKCHGSGYVEIVLEAQLVTSGRLKIALQGPLLPQDRP